MSRGTGLPGRGSGESDEPTALDESISDWLVADLQRRIFSGEIRVGAWLRHAAIAEEYATSRTPVREALRVLGAQGVVTIVRNRGARVNGHSGRDIRELGDVRAELEGLAAQLAARHINDKQLAELQQARQDFEDLIAELIADSGRAQDPGAGARWGQANEAFHSVILQASGNRQLALSIADVSRRLPKNSSYWAYAGNSRLLMQNVHEHTAISDAIVAHNGAAARKAMAAHIRSASESMARWTENTERDSESDERQ